ncbi:nucleotidyltransferase family protein [Arhodomonas aquaeolei]|uniref:nucleotidyltransferase family protein n=1 Tax=Arhodomonas aquaeolei TaxID=2369 RepID=UPI00037B3D30|nr:nucleotidyltransferase family protein [Arhodomonas aquaeolei]
MTARVIRARAGDAPVAPFDAVVLAADRGPADPVAAATGAACKVLAPVAGRPMVVRVLDALAADPAVTRTVLCGPPAAALAGCAGLRARVDAGAVDWLAPGPGPSASAEAGLAHLGGARPALVTTGDHALLTREMIDGVAAAAEAGGWDAVVGLVEYDTVTAAFPGVRRTVTRFSDAAVCGTNLFAFATPEGRSLVRYWQRVEARRKHPWQVVLGAVGPVAVVRYALGRLSLEAALEILSRRLGVSVGAVILPWARAGVDVDSAADLALAEAALAADRPAAPAGTGASPSA